MGASLLFFLGMWRRTRSRLKMKWRHNCTRRNLLQRRQKISRFVLSRIFIILLLYYCQPVDIKLNEIYYKLPCCWRLKCKPCGGLQDLRAFALSTIRGIVFIKIWSRSVKSRSVSRNVANPENNSGSCTSSSGSRLML